MMRHCIVHHIGEKCVLFLIFALFVTFTLKDPTVATAVMLQVKVDSVTGRDDSLMDSLIFSYTKYLLFWVKVKCPLIFSMRRDPLKKSWALSKFIDDTMI